MNVLVRFVLGASLSVPLLASAASLGPYPAGETCSDERNAAYADGFAAGDANGYDRGYWVGVGEGTQWQIAQCVADPQSCGITLASCIPDATYGETEPNDNLITADPLTLGVSFSAQNYSGADQDWFYTETTAPNQNLLLNFSVPNWIAGANLASGTPAVWNVSIRDAAGNIFANFNTNTVGGIKATDNAVTYSATLGLVGTYYVVVQPVDKNQSNQYSYSITAFLQDTTLDNNQPIAGFYDSEIEPNDLPSKSNPLATGVTMYGQINLTFNTPVESGTTFEWGQGEDDWYVYKSDGNEIITITLCAKDDCGSGNWLIEVYDQAMADRYEAGESRQTLTPLLVFNTNTVDQPTATYRLGLKDPGYYFMRVNHKRLFEAPCLAKQFVSSTSDTGYGSACECDSGNTCYVPADCSDETAGLVCQSVPTSCVVGIEAGCNYIQDSPPGCGVADADGNVTPCDTYQTQARCTCSVFGGVVQLPDNQYSSPYNFTWHSTQLPTNTIDTDAYLDYLNRSNPYN